jgi:hypothetical protein
MTERCNRNLCNVTALITVVLSSLILTAQSSRTKPSSVELRLAANEIVNGVPDAFSFVFVNLGDHEIRVPPVSPCVGPYSGTLILRVEFSPIQPQKSGKGGGCGGAGSHMPGILEQAKSWGRLQPGESLTMSYKRSELNVFEQAPGAYDFWGEYQPPKLTAEEVRLLEQAGMDFPRELLKSTHLRFHRRE